MKSNFSLVLLGFLIILIAVTPLLAAAFPNSEFLGKIPKAGSMTYQAILAALGIILLLLSAKRKPKQNIIIQKQ